MAEDLKATIIELRRKHNNDYKAMFSELQRKYNINVSPLQKLNDLRSTGNFDSLVKILYSEKMFVDELSNSNTFYFENLQSIAESVDSNNKYIYPLLYKNESYARAMWSLYWAHYQSVGPIAREINFLELSKLYEKFLEANRKNGSYLVDQEVAKVCFVCFGLDLYSNVKTHYNQNYKDTGFLL